MTELTITINTKEAIGLVNSKKDKWIKNIKNEMDHSALYLEGKTKESIGRGTNAPIAVDTGQFMRSPHGTAKELEATVVSNLDYAKDIEYGTSRMKARPHFRNTLAKEKQKIVDFIKQSLNR
jgi:hypothetical protein